MESILEDRYNPVTKRKEWKVKWLNFSEDYCTWEPVENLENNLQFHAYVENKIKHNLKVINNTTWFVFGETIFLFVLEKKEFKGTYKFGNISNEFLSFNLSDTEKNQFKN